LLTGAIAFRFLDYVNRNNIAKNCHVTICDMNETMMEIAKRKAVKYDPNLISFVKGNVEDLPFENASFNAYTMCFGMRYVRNIDKVFDEAYRVLQPGGKFLNLEFSHVEDGIVKWSVICLEIAINIIIIFKVIQSIHKVYHTFVRAFV
jgi:ubiquinone/menaquinone biosynthesis C-methylase UbiE